MKNIRLNAAKVCILFCAVLIFGGGISVHASDNNPAEYLDESTISESEKNAEVQRQIRRITSKVDPSWSEEEKALYIHEYICSTVEYDWDTYRKNEKACKDAYNSYGAIVRKKAVCSGYAAGYKELMNALGIECEVVISSKLNHAWNIIKINNKWYYVDCTWDDPGDVYGYSNHRNFLVSRDTLHNGGNGGGVHNSSDWKVNWKDVYRNDRTSKDHDDYYWVNAKNVITNHGDKWLYVNNNGAYYHNYSNNSDVKVSSVTVENTNIDKYENIFSLGQYKIYVTTNDAYLVDSNGIMVEKFSCSESVSPNFRIQSTKLENSKLYLSLRRYRGTIDEIENDESRKFEIDWSRYSGEQNLILNEGNTKAFIGEMTVFSDLDSICLMDNYDNSIVSTFELGNEEKKERYIHDIKVSDGIVTYTTWLKIPVGNGTEEQTRKPKTKTYDGWKNYVTGSCGENLTWTFNNGKLIISGSGDMAQYEHNGDVPWFHLVRCIKEVDILDGVTSISNDTFYINYHKLKTIRIPESVNSIGRTAIYSCKALEDVYYAGSEMSWNNIYRYDIDENNQKDPGTIRLHFGKQDTVENYHSFGNVRWNIKNGVLTISGSGKMNNVQGGETPWYPYRKKIKKVVIEKGVTSICSYAFWSEENLREVYIPDSITILDYCALMGINEKACIYYEGSKAQLESMIYASGTVYSISGKLDCKKVTVEYSYSGTSNTVVIDKNTIPSRPADPSMDYYRFDGWFTSYTYDVQYNFNTPITEDTTLYAKFTLVGIGGNQDENNPDGSDNGNPNENPGIPNYDPDTTGSGNGSGNGSELPDSDAGSGSSMPGSDTTQIPHENRDVSTSGQDDSMEDDLPKDGIISVNDNAYRLNADGTAAAVEQDNKNISSVKIGESVTYNGKVYEITEIKDGAYKNCKNLKSVTIGANVRSIGASAFAGCKKLKKITINAINLQSIGKGCLKKIKKGAKITIICKDKKTYKSIVKKLKKAGAKTAKFKFKKG